MSTFFRPFDPDEDPNADDRAERRQMDRDDAHDPYGWAADHEQARWERDRGHATLDLCLASATIGLACLALIEPRLLLVVAGCLVAWLVLSVPLALGMGRLLARGGEEG